MVVQLHRPLCCGFKQIWTIATHHQTVPVMGFYDSIPCGNSLWIALGVYEALLGVLNPPDKAV